MGGICPPAVGRPAGGMLLWRLKSAGLGVMHVVNSEELGRGSAVGPGRSSFTRGRAGVLPVHSSSRVHTPSETFRLPRPCTWSPRSRAAGGALLPLALLAIT